MNQFSVLLSVYFKENHVFFKESIYSILNQTYQASEIVLVKDGNLSKELDKEIDNFVTQYPKLFKIIALDVNQGLGEALRQGLEACTYNIVARMDTDDICVKTRFETQILFLQNNPEIDVVGSNIEEFNIIPGDLKRFKINPEKHSQLVKNIKLKSPLNHPSIMFRKESVYKAGSYNGDLPLFEDYSLFLRMWKTGCKFHNIQEVLLYFRVGNGLETIKRRSGIHYLKKELKFIDFASRNNLFTFFDVYRYKILKLPFRLLPPNIILFIYNLLLRK